MSDTGLHRPPAIELAVDGAPDVRGADRAIDLAAALPGYPVLAAALVVDADATRKAGGGTVTRCARVERHVARFRPRFVAALVAMAAWSVSVADARAQASGYVVAGPAGYSGFFGTSAPIVHAGAGGDLAIGHRVGVGGEAGVLDRLIVVSASGIVQLGRDRAQRVAPFAAAGYSRLGAGHGDGAFSAWHVAGGVHWWLAPRLGFRVEVRDHIRPDDRGTVQYWSVRGGVTFR